MLWIGQAFSTPAFLKSRLIFGFVVGIAATVFFTWILFQMERNNASYQAALMEAQMGDRDTQLELEEETEEKKYDDGSGGSHGYVQAGNEEDFSCSSPSSPTLSPKNNSLSDDGPLYKPGESRHRSLTRSQQITIVLHVSVLILLNYLLLVFLPGSAVLAFVAMVAIWILALNSYLRDELQRRQRWDRLLTLIALFLVIAGCLTLITYCRLALHDGNVYQGPARIVGYDLGVYDNTDEETLRADVQVTWGGSWGCPDNSDRVCTATVQGALCETKYNAEDYATGDDAPMGDDATMGNNNNGNDRRRRRRPLKRRFLNKNETAAEGTGGDQEKFTDEEKQEMATKEEQDEGVYEEELDSEYEEVVVEDEEIVDEEANEEVADYEEEVSDEAEVEIEEYEDELDEEYEDEVEDVEEEKAVAEEEVQEVEEVEVGSEAMGRAT